MNTLSAAERTIETRMNAIAASDRDALNTEDTAAEFTVAVVHERAVPVLGDDGLRDELIHHQAHHDQRATVRSAILLVDLLLLDERRAQQDCRHGQQQQDAQVPRVAPQTEVEVLHDDRVHQKQVQESEQDVTTLDRQASIHREGEIQRE